ncbi:hypothetical protein B0T18DRAFT_237174 [Schizothecium vesticola]|uniref:Uncharacterized protein n=1 Tax=Schizothecium vesticola TaxID=314040 RepID=A0AA40BPJ4_9PEZI|nr:hypothetical protein B0T18DRAFT_237174 [Schizothecium vesticola]
MTTSLCSSLAPPESIFWPNKTISKTNNTRHQNTTLDTSASGSHAKQVAGRYSTKQVHSSNKSILSSQKINYPNPPILRPNRHFHLSCVPSGVQQRKRNPEISSTPIPPVHQPTS